MDAKTDQAYRWAKMQKASGGVVPRFARRLAAEIDRLLALEAKLPRCWGLRDGVLVKDVPVVPGMTLYREPGGYQFTLGEPCWDDLAGKWPSEYLRGADPTECCDSREAAEKRGEV